MISIAIVAFAAFIFMHLKKETQFIVFSLIALYPFTLGDFTSFQKFLVVEWLTAVIFLMLMNELVSVKTINKKINLLNFNGIHIFVFAIIILIIWLSISFTNNELLTTKLMTGSEQGIKRTYFDILNNILLFFTTLIFVVFNFDKISIKRFLNSILTISLIIGFVRIFTFYFDLNTPLLSAPFDHNAIGHVLKEGVSERYSGLENVGLVGIPALFGLYVYTKKINWFALIILLFFFFLSGGRSASIGIMFSIVTFSFFFFPKNFLYISIIMGILFVSAVIFLPESFFSGQVSRFSTLEQSGFMGMDLWRGTAWKYYLENFNANPIFGKGIGEYLGYIYAPDVATREFARSNLFAGGHGSYMSLLSTLGIGGLLYFLIMVVGGVILSFKKIVQYISVDEDKLAIAVFCFMLLLDASILFIVGYNGLTDVQLMFYTVGLICSIRVIENQQTF